MGGDLRQLAGDGVNEPVELGVDRRGVGLVIDRVQQRLDPRARTLSASRTSDSRRSEAVKI
jgi:hypothetical protein